MAVRLQAFSWRSECNISHTQELLSARALRAQTFNALNLTFYVCFKNLGGSFNVVKLLLCLNRSQEMSCVNSGAFYEEANNSAKLSQNMGN